MKTPTKRKGKNSSPFLMSQVTTLGFCFMLFLSSCTGPAGPDGPIGPAGPTGATGPTGAAGPTGSANVIYSNWATISSANWVLGSFYTSYTTYYYDVPAPSLSQTMLDRGVILVYAKWIGGTGLTRELPETPVLLPYFWNYDAAAGYSEQLFAIAQLNNVEFRLQQYGVNAWIHNLTTSYRYVLIPGAQAGGRIAAPVDYTNYQAVKNYYHIPD